MSLAAELAHQSAIARIRVVACTPEDPCCGPVERATVSTLVLPLRGVFVKHHDRGNHVVADVCHAVFFNADEPYRVSHPVGGDECLAIEPASDVLRDIVDAHGERGSDEGAGFGRTHALLSADLIVARKSLSHRLAHRLAGALEADESALQLLAATTLAAYENETTAKRERKQTQLRYREMVDATKLALAAEPGRDWTLAALAKRVYSSPFHLARIFKRYAGIPIHRYHLFARMAAAVDDIVDTSRDVVGIGADLGFSSHSHFSAAFRRIFGVTPTALRASTHQRDAIKLRKILTADRPTIA